METAARAPTLGLGPLSVFEIELLSIADKSKDKAPGAGEDKK